MTFRATLIKPYLLESMNKKATGKLQVLFPESQLYFFPLGIFFNSPCSMLLLYLDSRQENQALKPAFLLCPFRAKSWAYSNQWKFILIGAGFFLLVPQLFSFKKCI